MQSTAVTDKRLPRALARALIVTLAAAALTFALHALLLSTMPPQLKLAGGVNYTQVRLHTIGTGIIVIALVVVLPASYAMYHAALKIRGGTKIFIGAQIFAIAIIGQWLAWKTLKFETPVMPLIFGLIGAAAWGHFDRRVLQTNRASVKNDLALEIKQDELREAHLQLVKQDEADRRILASDLHDQVLNDLKALRQSLEALKEIEDAGTRAAKTAEIEAMIDQTTGQVREVMENLTPSVLENLGLASALDDLLRRSGSRGKFKVRFKNEAAEDLSKLSKIEELLLFRTVQEALSNSIKHAQAGRVELSIVRLGSELVVTIADDGLGIPQDKERGLSRGLRYMRQRADLLGATIAWLPGREKKGCTVEIKIESRG